MYGVFGPDAFQRGDFILQLRQQVLPEGETVRFESYSGAEGWGDILTAAQTLPWGGGKKMVVVRDCDKIPEEDRKALERYLENPNPTTVMVLEGEKPADKELRQRLQKCGRVVEAQMFKPRQVSEWLVRRAREKGKKLEPEAAAIIAERVGSNLALADQELEKTLIYAGGKAIRREEVIGTLSLGGGGVIWDLFERIGSRDSAGALKVLSQLLRGGDHPLLIVVQLANRLRKLYAFRLLREKGEQEAEIGKRLGIKHPYALKCFGREARAYSAREIRKGLLELGEIDWTLKRSPLPARLLLEMFLIGLISGRGREIRKITGSGPAAAGSDGKSSGKPSGDG